MEKKKGGEGRGVTLGPEITSFRGCKRRKAWQRECAMAYSSCPGLSAVVVSENFGNKLTLAPREREGAEGREFSQRPTQRSVEPIERQRRP